MERKILYIIFGIIILVGLSIVIFPSKWSKLINKHETEQFKAENKKLSEENERIRLENLEIRKRVISDSLKIVKLEIENKIIDEKLKAKDVDIAKDKKKISNFLSEEELIRNNIEDIRTIKNEKRGEELILSVKTKLK